MLGGALQLGIACEEAWTQLVAAEWSGRSGPLQAVLHFQGVNLWFPHYRLPPGGAYERQIPGFQASQRHLCFPQTGSPLPPPTALTQVVPGPLLEKCSRTEETGQGQSGVQEVGGGGGME